MKLPLRGIIPPMVTPLHQNMDLDKEGLKKLIAHMLQGGVHGIFILGTNGEGPSLGYDLKKQLITETCRIVNQRVPVLVGVTDSSLESTVKITNHSKKVGADAVVVAPPHYFPITQQEMVNYLRALVPQLALPFLVYDIPSCTKLHLSVETIKSAKDLGAIGVKDSSGDMGALYAIMEEFKDSSDFSIISGTELFLPDTIMYGGHGAVAGGANLLPRLFVDLYEASLSKDVLRIKALHLQVLKLNNTIYNIGKSKTKSIKAIKCALSILGICNDYMAQPLIGFTNEQKSLLKRNLYQLDYAKNHISVV